MKEVNKDIVMSDSYKAMAELQDNINYVLENGEFNKNALLIDADNLLAYEEITKNNALSGLYLANKGFETLIIGGLDYTDTLQYRDSLIWDEELKKDQHIVESEKENPNTPFLNYVIACAKTLRENECGFIKNNKDIYKIMPFFDDNER